jgi:hypothetical protein
MTGPARADTAADDADHRAMTAVVIARDDAAVIGPRLAAVISQGCAGVVAVVSGSSATAALIAHEFPDVPLVELPEVALPGRARNAGLHLADGEVVTFPGSHVELRPGCLEARLRAHDAGWAMVAAATENGTDTPAGWSSYFLDHSAALPTRPAGEIEGPPGNCSYLRRLLVEIGGFPEHLRAGEDTWVNRHLVRLGHRAWFEPAAVQVHHSPCDSARVLLRHHLARGRGLAGVGLAGGRQGVGDAWRASAPIRRSRRIAAQVEVWGDATSKRRWRDVRVLILAGAVAYRIGFLLAVLRPSVNTWQALRGRTATTVVLAGLDRRNRNDRGRADVLLVASRSHLDGVLRVVSLPRDFLVELPEHGPQKVNAAFALGGPSLLAEAVARAFGVRADGVVGVDFGGFRKLIDRLGGVEIDVPIRCPPKAAASPQPTFMPDDSA